jgi:hypothetical protein
VTPRLTKLKKRGKMLMDTYSFIDQKLLQKELTSLGVRIKQKSAELSELRAEGRKLQKFLKEEIQNEKS